MSAQIKNKTPLISVLMPVYNSDAYVSGAIQSILEQSQPDFELIIINDGSSDTSEPIILSFNDPRVKYVRNETNLGIIASLNKGIDLAKGKFIARMDADDIALPNRFELQLKYMNEHPEAAMVCSPSFSITPAGNPAVQWNADIETRTSEQIRKTLARENCITHPSIFIRADVLKEYRYRAEQKGSEDWDLWMRLVSDGNKIIKTREQLLKYRIHPQSSTVLHNTSTSVESKVIKVRRRFLAERLRRFRFRGFEFLVFYALLRSVARHFKKNIIPAFLRNLKRLFTQNPFEAARQFRKLKNVLLQHHTVELYFFFPYCHIGGAEKVHANITEVFSDRKIIVFFTGISRRDDFLYLFEKFAPAVNAGLCLNHPFYASRSAKLILQHIAAQKETAVFGCNNLFFYNLVPLLKKSVRVFDLAHDFRADDKSDISHSFFPQYARCEKRIFISNRALNQTKLFYREMNADPELYERLELILNYTSVPEQIPEKDYSSKLKVLYVGRGTPEKRADLFHRLALVCKTESSDFEFTAIGDFKGVIPDDANVRLTGALMEFEKLSEFYLSHHVIVITSEREGFPMAIMEGMAYGLVPLSSPVGDVAVHADADRGFVTTTIEAEQMLKEMKQRLKELNLNRELLHDMSLKSYEYARVNFSKDVFFSRYKEVIKL